MKPAVPEETDIAEQVIASIEEPAGAADVGGTVSPDVDEGEAEETGKVGEQEQENLEMQGVEDGTQNVGVLKNSQSGL